MYRRWGKGIFDLIAAAGGLMVLLPLFLFLTVLLWFLNDGKPFFMQKRPGLHGVIFTLIKFRSMGAPCGPDGNVLPDSERITPVGRFLRRTSLDEIPQLWNVIRGEMSLVGPRPLLPEYLPLYTSEQRLRHLVKPGMTGWAQVNGRNVISWEEKFRFDLWYVHHVSLSLDIKIIFRTLQKLVGGNNQSEIAIPEKFEGN
jgi:undecaprenyl phosphate N,N'-diacetylbacillosamine 1-phosphate transferase